MSASGGRRFDWRALVVAKLMRHMLQRDGLALGGCWLFYALVAISLSRNFLFVDISVSARCRLGMLLCTSSRNTVLTKDCCRMMKAWAREGCVVACFGAMIPWSRPRSLVQLRIGWGTTFALGV